MGNVLAYDDDQMTFRSLSEALESAFLHRCGFVRIRQCPEEVKLRVKFRSELRDPLFSTRAHISEWGHQICHAKLHMMTTQLPMTSIAREKAWYIANRSSSADSPENMFCLGRQRCKRA